jgi:glycosyltransferase involved in cell wall biosynthesis
MNLAFVGHRCCDHSPSSGYDQVCALFPNAGWLSGPDLAAGDLRWFREPDAIDAQAAQVFHVFYGDCSGSALPAILRQRFPHAVIVSTVHQPVDRLRNDPAGYASLYSVDGIITVSRIQLRQLTKLRLDTPIRFVPHGVWTDIFRPPGVTTGERKDVLLVGNYLRDWDGTARLVHKLAAAGVRTVVVGSAAASRLSVEHPLVELRSHISEPDLTEAYDRSAALLLPVLDATASNALLEAMSSGCPVICPRLPSLVDDYLGDGIDAFEPGDYDRAAELALGYIAQPERRAARSKVLLERVRRFDWSHLGPELQAAYEAIVAQVRPAGRSASRGGRPARHSSTTAL